jgi:hypothetical protein
LHVLSKKVLNCTDKLVIYQAYKVVLYAASLHLLEQIIDEDFSFMKKFG